MNKPSQFSLYLSIILVIGILVTAVFITSPPTGDIFGSLSLEISVNEGNIIVTILAVSSLTFAVANVNWGVGFVNTSSANTACILDTEGTNDPARCSNFTTVTQGFVLENNGNNNLTINLESNATVEQFVTGNATINSFRWKVAENETGSCNNLTGPTTYVDVNTSSPGTLICQTESTGGGGFNFLDDKDTLLVNINITIPSDALPGIRTSTLTATGTSI